VLWLALAAVLVILGLVLRRAGFTPGRAGLGLALAVAALVGVALMARFGPKFLAFVAPTLGWLAWRWLRARAAAPGATPPFEAPPRRQPMTREEALRILGLREGASAAEIVAAHRSLIKKLHPDHGGSDHLAQQVNEAKRVLQSDA
jgi:hypothetical protein